MTPAAAAQGQSRWAAFLASPWTAVIAVVVAAALVIGGLVLVKDRRTHRDEVAPVALGEPAPSDFEVGVATTSSPFVTRGEPVGLALTVAPGVEVSRLELWQDDQPYYVVDDGELIAQLTSNTMRLSVDLVPMRAGAHVVVARAFTSDGKQAQSIPISLPVMDLPQDLGVPVAGGAAGAPYPAMRFAAAPGDSLQSIADRLGVDAASLVAADGTTDAGVVLASGMVITGTVPSLNSLKPPVSMDLRFDTDIDATVDGCTVVVTSQTKADLRIYGGAGMVALGDLPQGGTLTLDALPIGPTMLVAYSPSGAAEVLPPSAPVTVTIPDECARDAWTGDAYITGGMLLTDAAITQPYAYIAIDKGAWRRVPAKDGAFLNAGSVALSDLRALVDLAHYDQIDLEVWSGQTGQVAAAGQFCRKDSAHTQAGASSGSGGECTPAAVAPSGAPGTVAAKPISLTMSASGSGQSALTRAIYVGDQPPAMQSWQLTGPAEVSFTTDAVKQGYSTVVYQFSLIPFSAGSAGLHPPGMFYSVHANVEGHATVEPWKWHGALVSEDDLDDVDNLALDDQLALELLKQRIADGANLIDTVYVRAVAIEQVPNTSDYVPRGATSNTIEIEMPTSLDGTWPAIDQPRAVVAPGRDIMSITNGRAKYSKADNPGDIREVSTTCHEVAAYPDPASYVMYPFNAPKWRAKDGVTYQAGAKRDPSDVMVQKPGGMSDLSQAKMLWPRDDVIYCLDSDAAYKRQLAANEYEPPQCSLGCVLSFVVYGAMVGFTAGGPWGALAGALGGLAVGLGSAADPSFYASVMEAWDAVSGFYNKVFDTVAKVMEYVNPACLQASALGSKAHDFCNKTFRAVGEAVLTYYTGVPPRLATSKDLEASAAGNLNAMVTLALDEGLKKLGLSCKTFTASASEAQAILTSAKWAGADVPDLKEFKDSQGTYSGCAALAGVLSTAVHDASMARQAQVMQAITGVRSIPGMVISPVADERPRIVISGVPVAAPGSAQTCPIVANVEITEGGTTYRLYPLHDKAWLKYGKTDVDGVRAADVWTGEIAVPYERSLSYPTQASKAVMETAPAKGGAAYLHATVSSPCFDQPLVVDAPKYTFFGGTAAYYPDFRPIVAYH